MSYPLINHSHRARLGHVADGDTVTMLVDLDFRVMASIRVRLQGINAPELTDPDPVKRAQAQKAKDYVANWFQQHMPVSTSSTSLKDWPYVLESSKTAAYDRWDGIIWALDGSNLNDDIVAAGLATKA